MSNYRSMIDQALETARARAHTPVETAKVASAPGSFLIKEAEEIAGALEFLSLSASGGDKVAAFRQEMIRDFYKTATASPAQGPTAATGTQGIAPSEGKTRLAPKGLVGGNSPAQGSATPEAKDGEKPLRESFKQAGGQSLYDVLMNNKTAGMGGPAEHDSETMAGVSTQNENSTYRKTLHTNEGPVNANRRELKKNTRARLSEAFGHTSDTLGDATASQIFPQAASRGHLKVSSVAHRLHLLKEAAEDKSKDDRDIFAVFGKRTLAPSSYNKIRKTAIDSHGMSGKTRMEMMRKSLEARGEDERRRNYRGAAGAAVGAAASAAAAKHFGRSLPKTVGYGLAGGALTGAAAALRSESNRLKAKNQAKDPSAVMAELEKTRRKGRVRDEAKTLAQVVAARQGRKVQGNPLIRIDRADGGK
jgi:hypothetical protein